jgi:hypothetical protein
MNDRRIVIGLCGGIAAAMLALIVLWALTGDLQLQTVLMSAVLIALLVGIGLLARRRVGLAAGVLAGLLMLLVAGNDWVYGVGSASAAAFVLPVLLVTRVLGLRAGLLTAVIASAFTVLVAWGSVDGWLPVITYTEESRLTFDAPVLVVLFVLTALIGAKERG